jgi:hypothetical protein
VACRPAGVYSSLQASKTLHRQTTPGHHILNQTAVAVADSGRTWCANAVAGEVRMSAYYMRNQAVTPSCMCQEPSNACCHYSSFEVWHA